MSSVIFSETHASIRPEKIRVADAKKTEAYLKDGLYIGGDKAINQVILRDIRRSANAGFERIVLDFDGLKDGQPAAISRAPYFQVSMTPDENRIVVTIFGDTKLQLDAKRIVAAFNKSEMIKKVQLLPKLLDDSWTFVLELKKGRAIEVFELGTPVRIILDIKGSKS